MYRREQLVRNYRYSWRSRNDMRNQSGAVRTDRAGRRMHGCEQLVRYRRRCRCRRRMLGLEQLVRNRHTYRRGRRGRMQRRE